MATELEARGCNLADSLWSAKVLVENPDLIREVHLDYYRAGAQVAITASYRATPAGFAARGLDEAQSRALIGKSVELARKAREAYRRKPARGHAAGSGLRWAVRRVSGRRLRVSRRLRAQCRRIHRIPSPARGSAAGRGCRPAGLRNAAVVHGNKGAGRVADGISRARAWFSFTLRDSEHLSDGTPLREVVSSLQDYPQVVALGINCIALENTTAALKQLQSLTPLPLVVYPNSGEHYDAVTKTGTTTAKRARRWWGICRSGWLRERS